MSCVAWADNNNNDRQSVDRILPSRQYMDNMQYADAICECQ